MEVEKGSHMSSKRSCFTQTSFSDEDSSEDTQLEYLSAQEEYEEEKNNSSEFSEQREIGEVKDMPLIGDKVPPQVTAEEEESGKSDRHMPSVAAVPDTPLLSAGERAPLCKHAESSDFSSCEEPVPCTRGTDSTADDAETQFPVSEILPSKNPGAGMEAAEKSPGGGPSAVKSECGEALKSTPSVSEVVQPADGSSDFRACFPTSRSSSAPVCLSSRAINTEITMMNKLQPVGWLGQTFVDAPSNTEWRAWSSHIQESKDRLCTREWNTGTGRSDHPNKQTRKNSASRCCQDMLQRATEAELQLLTVHYEMCYEHCLKVYELALAENTRFGRYEEKTELYSSLLLVLDELDNNYSNMRMEMNMGIPLNELPPLSVELKFSPLSSFYTPSKFLRKSLCSDDLSGERKADFEEPKVKEKGISVCLGKSQTCDQPSDSASSETFEEQPKDQVLEHEVKTVESRSEDSLVHVRGPKPSVPEDPGQNSLQKTSSSSTDPSGIFVSPYALNLSSFTKLIRRLQEKHPEFSRDKIVEAVKEVRRINKGVLSGLAISTIEEKASAILRKWMACCKQEKQ